MWAITPMKGVPFIFIGICGMLSIVITIYGYFYCICLLHIMIDDILQQVLKSVTKNGEDYIIFTVILPVINIQAHHCCGLLLLV